MPGEIHIDVRLDANTFRRYCAFDALKRQRRWYWPALASMLLVTAALAGLLGWIPISATLSGLLMGLGLAVVMLNVGLYLVNVETQVARQRLKDRPLVYMLNLDEDGIRVTNGQRTEPPVALPWDSLFAAYAHRGDIYLYVNPERALILPKGQASVSMDILWGFLEKHLGKGRCLKL
jgi:hypothetical protein